MRRPDYGEAKYSRKGGHASSVGENAKHSILSRNVQCNRVIQSILISWSAYQPVDIIRLTLCHKLHSQIQMAGSQPYCWPIRFPHFESTYQCHVRSELLNFPRNFAHSKPTSQNQDCNNALHQPNPRPGQRSRSNSKTALPI